MYIVLYGTQEDYQNVGLYLKNCELQLFTRTETLISAAAKRIPDAVFVTRKSAAGMEGVIAVKKILPEVPVAWFSSDRDFAPQAYRMFTEYFTTIPISQEKIFAALKRCGLLQNLIEKNEKADIMEI